jgi:Skp family chaperone for outer membrane proteins
LKQLAKYAIASAMLGSAMFSSAAMAEQKIGVVNVGYFSGAATSG